MIESKRYLEEVRKADQIIEELTARRDELKTKAMSLGSMASDGMNIQKTAPDGSRTADAVIRYTSIESELSDRIYAYIAFKHHVADQIDDLPNATYARLLDLRYLRYMKLDKIAEAMHYSPEHTRKLHGYALLQFWETYQKEIEAFYAG